MANEKKRGIKRIFSAMMAAAIAATTITAAMPLTAVAEYSGGIIDDKDGKFYAAEVTGATSAEWDGTVATGYAGGTGTEADPYQIATGEQLAYLAQQVDEGNDYEGVYFKLTADILLNDDIEDDPNEWNPIGGYYTVSGTNYSSGFAGTFDGADHKVIGMYINDNQTDAYGEENGLFARVSSVGTVKNVGVTDGRMVCAGYTAGGICGDNEGTISNCYNTVKITSSSSYDKYGGVCGENNGTIENSYNKGELYITGDKYYIGGVCGYNYVGTIDGCYNTGRVYTTADARHVGGVCGLNEQGTVKDSYNTGEVNGYGFTGGVCGYNYAGTVKTSYNKGEVTGRYCNTGGVCGKSYSSDATDTILKCYNEGDVICAYSSGTDTYTGGICGNLSGYLIKQCYNKGTVTNAYNNATAGICGYMNKGEIRECYNSGAISGRGAVAGITGYMYTNCVLENCYNMGALKATNGYAGGVWGNSSSSSANTMRNCYNIGSVSATVTAYPVGENKGQITNVYYDSDVVTATETGNADFARTTAQLTSCTALDDLGFDSDIWTKKENTSACWYYPDLKNIDGDQPMILVGTPVPTGLKATASSRSVKLTWDATDGAEKYAVYKYVDGKYTTLTSTLTTNSYTVTGLKNGVKVGFKIKAYVNGKWSDACDVVYATPKAPAPTGIKATAGDAKATVTWGAVSGATKYAVYKYIDGKYTCLTTAVTGTSYTVTGLENGTKYGFKVKAYVDQWSGASAMAYATPVSANIVPQNIKTTVASGKVRVNWDKVSGATKYAVYIYEDGKYTCLNSSITTNTYLVTGLENGTKYGFKVKAYVGKWSGASAMAYATPVGNVVPQNVKAYGADSEALVTWSAVDGATKYAVYIYIDGKYTCINSNIKTTSYTVSDLVNGTRYGFKVKAYVGGKWSGASSMAYATPNA